MSNKNLTKIAMLACLAIIFGYVESLLPPLFLPGIKIGISNIVLVFAIYHTSKSSAFFIMLIKVLVSSLLFSGMNTFFYSLSGGILSILAIMLSRKSPLSPVGVSILGGIAHNIGQLLTAGIVLGVNALYYFPVLLISGAVMGFLIGIVAVNVMKYTKKATDG